MSTRRGLRAREVLSVLNDIPKDVSEYGDESCSLDADDDFIPEADESISSSEDECECQCSRYVMQMEL